MPMPPEDRYHETPLPLPESAFLAGPSADEEWPPLGHPAPSRHLARYPAPSPHPAKALVVAGLLFAATLASTFLAGMGADLFWWLDNPLGPPRWLGDPRVPLERRLANGATFSSALMLILLCHELGHYIQARRYRIPASLPFFIPMPISPFGTMGAVIVQAAGYADRKAMFDIAISGPLAGLLVALPVAWWGVQQAEVMEIPANVAVMQYGDPLIIKAMVRVVHGPLPPNHDVVLNPLLFAGWVGIFLTGLNLLPVSQLDGGHIMYGLLGRRAHRIAWGVLAAGGIYMLVTGDQSYGLIFVLLLLLGVRHPPTTNDRVPLGAGRVLLGWFTMALFLVCFTLRPLTIHVPQQQPRPAPRPAGQPELLVSMPGAAKWERTG
uniref:Site-2 protease family protein n=1 Tax=Schlesneria paludicola TaxID=360056 RepID=A0A7C4QPG2_9PLAN